MKSVLFHDVLSSKMMTKSYSMCLLISSLSREVIEPLSDSWLMLVYGFSIEDNISQVISSKLIQQSKLYHPNMTNLDELKGMGVEKTCSVFQMFFLGESPAQCSSWFISDVLLGRGSRGSCVRIHRVSTIPLVLQDFATIHSMYPYSLPTIILEPRS